MGWLRAYYYCLLQLNIANRIGMAACRSRLGFFSKFSAFRRLRFAYEKSYLKAFKIVLFSALASRSGFGAVMSCAAVRSCIVFCASFVVHSSTGTCFVQAL